VKRRLPIGASPHSRDDCPMTGGLGALVECCLKQKGVYYPHLIPFPHFIYFNDIARDMISGYKAVGFDMDGTLLNTKLDLVKMSNLLFDEMVRVGVPEEFIDRTQGSKFNLDTGIKFLAKAGRMEEIYEIQIRLREQAIEIEMENADLARPFPGAMKLLKDLKKKGYKVGVLTRGSRKYAEYVLKLTGTYEFLDALVCRDDHSEREAKPAPEALIHFADAIGENVKDIIYIGDHSYDYLCAKSSGAGFIGVLTGGYTKEDWKALDQNIEIINTIADIEP